MGLDVLARRMAALAAHDPHCQLFGADMHGWQTTPVELPGWRVPAEARVDALLGGG